MNLLALLAFGLMLIAGSYASWLNRVLYEQQARADVFKELSVVGARLEGNINGNLQLARSLVATIQTEPDMNQQRFSVLAASLFDSHSQLRNIAAAPDLVVKLMYPLIGNEKALGLDYSKTPAQRDAALKARDTRSLVVAGPVDLVQGGRGIIGRFPVFIGASYTSQGRFWGLVSVVIDLDELYLASGVTDAKRGIDIAISGRDGEDRTRFFGMSQVLENNPVTANVMLPSGSWELAAIPRGGWHSEPPNAGFIWAGFILLGLMIAVPILLRGRMVEERQRSLKEIQESRVEAQVLSRRLELALETSQVGVFELDLETGQLFWDQRVNAVFGLPPEGERSYAVWRDALHPEDRQRAEEEFTLAVDVTGRYRSEYRIVTAAGAVRNIRAIGAVYRDAGTTRKIVGVNWDVTADVALNEDLKRASRLSDARNAELEAAKAAIEFNALHDALTGLPNRRYLDQMLRMFADRAAAEHGSLSLLHIDLDRFKQINDTLGHAAGDAMLVHAAAVLKANIRGADFVARIGGDEFVVAGISDGRESPLARLADRIITSMRQPVMYEGHECRFGVSVGIASEVGGRADPQRLLIDADIALYKAKRKGRNRYEFFTEALQAEVVRTKHLADEILNGIEQNQFEAFYQPQFDAETLDVVGVEALARWRHPTAGILPPSHFLGVAEELNVVPTIDRIVLEHAMRRFEVWEAAGLGVPRISVNVSARRLQDEQLGQALRSLSFKPGTLSFELVESIFLDETDDLMLFAIEHIKELGIDIEIDDFGTGYASIISLLKLRPKRLKIDRQLIMPIVEDVAQRQLVRSIVDNGRLLGIEVIGEGVETLEHARLLREMGCKALQGFAFARPMSASDLSVFLREQPWRETGAGRSSARATG